MLLGLDVGGTHTDAVLIDKSGVAASAKVPTRHDNLLESINDGIREVVRGVQGDAIERVNLSTTLSTNAIVEGKTERTGVIVSAGPGIEPGNYAIGGDYFRIGGSLDHRGVEVMTVDEQGLDDVVKSCRKAGIRVFAAVAKFSTRNPGHENAIKEKLKPGADFITVGHMLSGRLNFPRRIATAYYNSAVWRKYNGFAEAMEAGIRGFGITAPVNVLKADGGTMPLGPSRMLPVETILSGPAASVMGIIALCDITCDSVILDIGGTTTDIAVFASGAPLIEPDGIALDSRLTLVRSLKTRSIGIGGDSELRIDEGVVTVGPERKGPSIACGGDVPALIDALNFKKINVFGDARRSESAIADFAKKHRMKAEALADAAVQYAVRKIRNEVDMLLDEINERPVYTIHELLEGKKITPEAVYVMGGPARAFESLLAKEFNLKVVVPENYSVANAIGAGLARTTMYLELHADTEIGRLIIPDIDISRDIPVNYSLEEAEEDARRYLLGHMRAINAGDRHVHAEIIDSASFNMVRGYSAAGKNIRVKCQVKPGVLQEYRDSLRSLK